MEKCKLCLNERKLCKSHIIPEFMYSSTYDDKHKFIEFDACEKSFNKTRRKGIYEKLLCRDCEDKIKYFEDYGKEIIYQKVNGSISKSGDNFILAKYDYLRFKNFILSILWRASVSSQSFFGLVKLGKYEEELRKIMLKNTETRVDDFPCIISKVFIRDKPADGVFIEAFPTKSKVNHKTVYQMVIDGYFVFIGVGRQSIKTFKSGSSISPESLRISSDQLYSIEQFSDIYTRLEAQNKFKKFKSGLA